ncbi:MAG: hypothetical protein HFI86_02500 [Bacilli bacterium]|nr:hypothetical protein [Bacilli bacterium]
MSKIIVEIDTFKFEDIHILVGSDIVTRELHFYMENNSEIIPVSDVVKNRILTKLTKIIESSQSLNEIKQFIDYIGKKYLENNALYGFSNSVLQRNLQNLYIKCSECDLQDSSASYEAFHNIINIKMPRKYLTVSNINLELSLIFRQIIAHEIGHLSVSEIKLDGARDVIISTGFLQVRIPISESLKTSDGNEYYRLDNSKEIKENDGRGLEELYNALETDKVTNNAVSPNFAHRLDRVTEGKLRSARQNHSLEEYYEIMQSIISSYDRAQLLLIGLKCYYEAINGTDKELINQLNNMIERLIDDYEIHFQASNSKKGVI